MGAEVRADPVGQHGDVVQDGDAEQVIDLFRRQKLGLVDQQARHRRRIHVLKQGIRVVPGDFGGKKFPGIR